MWATSGANCGSAFNTGSSAANAFCDLRSRSIHSDILPRGPRRKVSEWMERDRKSQKALAAEEPVLNADPQLAPEVAHMLRSILPALQGEVEAEVGQLNRLDEG